MKTPTYALLLSLSLLVIFSCDDTATDEFNNINPDVGDTSNLITKIETESVQDASENKIIIISYDANDRVSSVSDGISAGVLVYSDGNLSNVAEGGEVFNISELINAPYDAFETGIVEEYDNNGNPVKITFYEEEVNESNGFIEVVEYKADVFYDNMPNPYFYTLEAAGVMDILDDVDINFSLNPQITDIVRARMLFPLNNIKRIVFKDNNSVVLAEVALDYIYNNSNHPISATVTATDISNNETSVYMLNYTYK